MKLCQHCNISHNKKGIYCSRSCVNRTRGPRSEETKAKMRTYALANPKGVIANPALYRNGKGRKWAQMQIKTCPTCDKNFETYTKWGKVFAQKHALKTAELG